MEVSDSTVSQQKEDLVLVELHARFYLVPESPQERGTVGRAIQGDILQGLLVRLDDIGDTLNFRLVTLTVDREAEIDCSGGAWHVVNDTTESENREVFVVIVRLQDLTASVDGSLVLIVLVESME